MSLNGSGNYFSGTYTPFICNINGVIKGNDTIIGTSVNHAFVIGNEVLFSIPKEWGITQLNGLKGFVISTTLNTITVNIRSLDFNSFVIPASYKDPAQVMCVGGQNTGTQTPDINNPTLNIPGAYKNTYP